METKPLIYGLIGFMLGGLVVSTAAVTTEKSQRGAMTMAGTLEGKSGDEFDKAFLNGMIIHHQDAIDMANQAKVHARHAQVKQLADEIITAQSKEIEVMQAWQADWGYRGASAPHDTHE